MKIKTIMLSCWSQKENCMLIWNNMVDKNSSLDWDNSCASALQKLDVGCRYEARVVQFSVLIFQRARQLLAQHACKGFKKPHNGPKTAKNSPMMGRSLASCDEAVMTVAAKPEAVSALSATSSNTGRGNIFQRSRGVNFRQPKEFVGDATRWVCLGNKAAEQLSHRRRHCWRLREWRLSAAERIRGRALVRSSLELWPFSMAASAGKINSALA